MGCVKHPVIFGLFTTLNNHFFNGPIVLHTELKTYIIIKRKYILCFNKYSWSII